MLLRPFGAMNGCRGTGKVAAGLAVAGAPRKIGPGSCSGIDGIGIAGMPGSADGMPAAATQAATRANAINERFMGRTDSRRPPP